MSHHNPASRLDVDKMFARHHMDDHQSTNSVTIRQECLELARTIERLTPGGPNQTIAIRHIEDALMRANKAIVEDKFVPKHHRLPASSLVEADGNRLPATATSGEKIAKAMAPKESHV